MLMVNRLAGFGAAIGRRISFIGSATSTGTTITMPADIQAGDLLVLVDFARSGSTPTDVVPTDWTGINTVSGSLYRHRNSYKLAAGTEGGTSVTGMVGSTLTRKIALVFRLSRAATTLTVGDADIEMVAGDPASDTITSGSGVAPLVVFASYGTSTTGTAVSGETFSPTEDGTVTTTNTVLVAKYKIYDGAPANVTADMGDLGVVQTLSSFYIEMS